MTTQPHPLAGAVKPLVWVQIGPRRFEADCDATRDRYYAENADEMAACDTERATRILSALSAPTPPASSVFGSPSKPLADSQSYRASPTPPADVAQCCMCGKKGLSTDEDGGPECELDDGRWTCSRQCWSRAVGEVPADVAGLLTGAVWHFMDAKTVENFGPWVRASDYATLSARVAGMERDIAVAEKRAADAENTYYEMHEEILSLSARVAELEGMVAALEATVETMDRGFHPDIEAAEARAAELEDDNAELLRLNAVYQSVHRWNTDEAGNGRLLVCKNHHEKGEPCEWEAFVPIERAEAAEASLATLLEASGGLGALPEGYCFCSNNRIGDDSKVHEQECADMRAAIHAAKGGT